MNNINDFETIQNLEILKNKVNDLLVKAEEKINLAQKIQDEAKLLKEDLSKVESVYNCLESLGGESSFIDLVNKIKTAEEFLNISAEKYQNLEQHLEEDFDLIESFFVEKETIITTINDELISLEKKRQEMQTFHISLMEEYSIVKESIKPILEIINSSEHNHVLMELLYKINSYQNDIKDFKKLSEEIKKKQEIYEQQVSNNIHYDMIILRKQQEKIDAKQRIQETNLDELNTKIDTIKHNLKRKGIFRLLSSFFSKLLNF